jgi:hypothetical protein
MRLIKRENLKEGIRTILGGAPKDILAGQLPGALPPKVKQTINHAATRALAALTEGRIEDLKLFLHQIKDATE